MGAICHSLMFDKKDFKKRLKSSKEAKRRGQRIIQRVIESHDRKD